MNSWRIVLASLRHYWRTNVFIVLGVAVATAVITGSLLVGDAMTGSLRENMLGRLGAIDDVMVTPHFFPATLGGRVAESTSVKGKVQLAPGIMTRGGARRDELGLAAGHVMVMGVDETYWGLFGNALKLKSGEAAVNRALAEDLHLSVGTEFVVSVDRSGTVTDDVLFAHRRREETLRVMRLTVAAIATEKEGGDFALAASVGGTTPRNVFVAREYLARTMDQGGLANFLLAARSDGVKTADLQNALRESCGLADYGFKLVPAEGYLALESAALLLTEEQIAAAKLAAKDVGAHAAETSVYLATRVEKMEGTKKEIAYAIVANVPDGIAWRMVAGTDRELAADGAVINEWAAADLGAKVGDPVEVTYLVPTASGAYLDATLQLKVVGIVAMEGPGGAAAERHMTPDLNGLTDAKRIEEWKLPFPVDHKKLTDRDEEYWEKYGATPKVFVSGETMREIWGKAMSGEALGPMNQAHDWATGVRITLPEGIDLLDHGEALAGGALLKRLTPEKGRLVFRAVREEMIKSAAGSTDFGQLFLAMSFFLVAAAGAMAGTLMRLLVEQRAGEIGVLMACGWRRRKVTGLLAREGLALVAKGVMLGVPAGVLYNWGILWALDRWWMRPWSGVGGGAVGGGGILKSHVTAETLTIGAASGLALGMICVWWGMRAMGKVPLLKLLSGRQMVAMLRTGTGRVGIVAAAVMMTAAGLMVFAAGNKWIAAEVGFFCGGALMLAGLLVGAGAVLGMILRRKGEVISQMGLAVRNAAANRRRSVLTMGLLASASFILVAVAANRRNYSGLDTSDVTSGTGGFTVRATTAVPVHFDLGTAEGRKRLGFSPVEEKAFAAVKVVSMAEGPGDDVSCLNLAKPMRPRLLGATAELAAWEKQGAKGRKQEDPWPRLFEGTDQEGAIPALGDADSVEWILKTSVGGIYEFEGPEGKPVKLRIVGVIPGSIFAGELLISEQNLKRIYPKITGSSYFLFAAPADKQAALMDALRSGLADQGVEVRSTREILNNYVSVQNVYLSIFLSLGGLGLLLGTAGLVAVIARSVLERRGELALMSAAGFRRGMLVRLVWTEHAGLLAGGLACGTAAALLAVLPVIRSAESDVQWGPLAGILGVVAGVGLLACIITAHGAIGSRPMTALREE